MTVIEPDHLETILINGILPPEFCDPHFIVRLFERGADGRQAIVRIRVAVSSADFCNAIRVAVMATPMRLVGAVPK